MTPSAIRLLISCPDQRGIVAAVAGFIHDHGGNILDADQHTDPAQGQFFMRVLVDPEGFDLDAESFAPAWSPLARESSLRWMAHWPTRRRRMAIFVSRESHCLRDLLWRWEAGELDAEIPIVISNHGDLRRVIETRGLQFEHLPVTADSKLEQEARVLELLAEADVDLVVLARYMQILSPGFIEQYANAIINIHHSFLPAFAGARPYHQAFERGVKLIGATSHYVTSELDAGPIIAQQTTHVGHRDSIEDLKRKGRDLERVVLAEAVRHHLEDRIIVTANRTVVFD